MEPAEDRDDDTPERYPHWQSSFLIGTARNLLLAERSRKLGLGGIHGGERGFGANQELPWILMSGLDNDYEIF